MDKILEFFLSKISIQSKINWQWIKRLKILYVLFKCLFLIFLIKIVFHYASDLHFLLSSNLLLARRTLVDSTARPERCKDSESKRSQQQPPLSILWPCKPHLQVFRQRPKCPWHDRALRRPHNRPSSLYLIQNPHLQWNQHWLQLCHYSKGQLPGFWWW